MRLPSAMVPLEPKTTVVVREVRGFDEREIRIAGVQGFKIRVEVVEFFITGNVCCKYRLLGDYPIEMGKFEIFTGCIHKSLKAVGVFVRPSNSGHGRFRHSAKRWRGFRIGSPVL